MAPPAAGKDLLTRGPIPLTLLMFALPILGSNVLQSLNASINLVWVGHYLGESAFAATSNANLILFFLLGVVFGISMATTILVGQTTGAGNIAEARRVVGTCTSFFALLSILVALLGFIVTPSLLRAMGTPDDAQPYAIAYLRIIFVALPPMYFYNFLMMTLRGAGDSRTPFMFMLLSVVLDVALNPVFIFGIGPIPRMGIAGSAVATLIAQTVSLGGLIFHLYHRKHFLCIRRGELGLLRPDPAILKSLIVKGLPMGLQMVVISSSAIVMIALVNRHGSQTTAAYGAAAQLWTYIQMPVLAVGSAVSSMVAQNVGARLWDRVTTIGRVGVMYNFVLTGALVALIYLFNRAALGLFLPDDGDAISIAQHLNAIVVWSFLFFGVTFVLFGVVRATGAVMAPLVILVISMWLVRYPFAALLEPRYGADAIWWSFPVGSLVSVTLAIGYYRFGNWRKARMLLPEQTPPAEQAPTTGAGAPALTVTPQD
ncbi:putative MATE family efflux protein [Luteibacter sp. Sphag1AF]|uniref:MATE family efflux transporter n=1 Tax=Luteibacter sp. Sphag1AF TaxID=2587031 RepID=UPI00160EE20B|nr:MATE family efflux transporter [Luteibacter sp. Sphag1AF]MBB3226708.1 putative MATE family efflux protein [Luteibacter sp. Sphag1AF]